MDVLQPILMCRDMKSTQISVGCVGPPKIDVAQKNWFEAVNSSLEANYAPSMQIHNVMQAKKNAKMHFS